MAKATFAAGCFWGVEDRFRKAKGVLSAVSGYLGGQTDSPTYRQVCTGTTGHAEAVEVEYDPEATTYRELLELFWGLHNPTTRDRQGPDVGSQYRSAVFAHDEEQLAQANALKAELDESGRWPRPIVTQVVPASTFWPAEDYHQRYYEKHGIVGSCHV